jgi:hypothetical protein
MATSFRALLRRTRVVPIIKSRVFIGTTAVCTGTLIAMGIAYASIPDSSGIVHGCVKTASATNGTHGVKVIDTATTPTCPTGFNNLNWPTKGQLLYQNSTFFSGPYTNGETVATFTGVPAGLMCVTGTASAFTTTSSISVAVVFTSPSAPQVNFILFANEANSHKALVEAGTNCATVPAGTYSYVGKSKPPTTSDSGDEGSISVQVFAN